MTSENHYDRRTLLKTAAGGVTGSLLVSSLSSAADLQSGRINGNLNQSVCKWCYKEMSVEQHLQTDWFRFPLIRLQVVLQRNVGRATGARSGPDWSQVG